MALGAPPTWLLGSALSLHTLEPAVYTTTSTTANGTVKTLITTSGLAAGDTLEFPDGSSAILTVDSTTQITLVSAVNTTSGDWCISYTSANLTALNYQIRRLQEADFLMLRDNVVSGHDSDRFWGNAFGHGLQNRARNLIHCHRTLKKLDEAGIWGMVTLFDRPASHPAIKFTSGGTTYAAQNGIEQVFDGFEYAIRKFARMRCHMGDQGSPSSGNVTVNGAQTVDTVLGLNVLVSSSTRFWVGQLVFFKTAEMVAKVTAVPDGTHVTVDGNGNTYNIANGEHVLTCTARVNADTSLNQSGGNYSSGSNTVDLVAGDGATFAGYTRVMFTGLDATTFARSFARTAPVIRTCSRSGDTLTISGNGFAFNTYANELVYPLSSDNIDETRRMIVHAGLASTLANTPASDVQTYLTNWRNLCRAMCPASTVGQGLNGRELDGWSQSQVSVIKLTVGTLTGTWKPTVGGIISGSAAVNQNATSAALQTALEGCSNVGAGNVAVTDITRDTVNGIYEYRVEFQGTLIFTEVGTVGLSNVSITTGFSFDSKVVQAYNEVNSGHNFGHTTNGAANRAIVNGADRVGGGANPTYSFNVSATAATRKAAINVFLATTKSYWEDAANGGQAGTFLYRGSHCYNISANHVLFFTVTATGGSYKLDWGGDQTAAALTSTDTAANFKAAFLTTPYAVRLGIVSGNSSVTRVVVSGTVTRYEITIVRPARLPTDEPDIAISANGNTLTGTWSFSTARGSTGTDTCSERFGMDYGTDDYITECDWQIRGTTLTAGDISNLQQVASVSGVAVGDRAIFSNPSTSLGVIYDTTITGINGLTLTLDQTIDTTTGGGTWLTVGEVTFADSRGPKMLHLIEEVGIQRLGFKRILVHEITPANQVGETYVTADHTGSGAAIANSRKTNTKTMWKPGGLMTLSANVTGSNVLTVVSVPADLEVGDFICIINQTTGSFDDRHVSAIDRTLKTVTLTGSYRVPGTVNVTRTTADAVWWGFAALRASNLKPITPTRANYSGILHMDFDNEMRLDLQVTGRKINAMNSRPTASYP